MRCLRPQPQIKTYILQYIHSDGNGYALVNANSPSQAESIFFKQTKHRDEYRDIKVVSIQESKWVGQETQLIDEGSVSTYGKSVYDMALLNGFKGTLDDFINSIKGEPGEQGKGVLTIQKTATNGLIDTYTITYTDGSTSNFYIRNGKDGDDGTGGGETEAISLIDVMATFRQLVINR